MASLYADFVGRLHRDKAFRRDFANDPHGTLRSSGLDPDLLDLPARIDLDELERRIEKNISSDPPDAAALEHSSAQELWDRHNFIRLKNPFPSLTITATGLIYGTTATTSLVITAQGAVAQTATELARLGRLRLLSKLPAASLRFAVSGPDGRGLHDLDIATIRALATGKRR